MVSFPLRGIVAFSTTADSDEAFFNENGSSPERWGNVQEPWAHCRPSLRALSSLEIQESSMGYRVVTSSND